MTTENISQELRLKNMDETRNCLIEEINQNELLRMKPKKVWEILTYIKHWLILACTVTGCVSISAFTSLVGITSSSIGLKNLCNKCSN